MTRRTLALIVYTTIGAYLAVLLGLALFVTTPPALGWVGLGVLTAIVLLAGTLVVVFFPRARTNADRIHPHEGGLYRLLVVTDAEVEPAELRSAVKLRVLGRRSEVRVVAPVVTPSALHFLADDEEGEHAAADDRLAATLHILESAGIEADGIVGTDDPLQAVGDALVAFPADEILLVASLPTTRTWLERDFEKQARDVFGVPVSTVYGEIHLSSAP
jgi:hypothetical protein